MKKRNCIWIVCLLIGVTTAAKSQVIKIENGISIATQTFKISGGDRFTGETIHPYQMSIGIEYLNKDWFYLSSSAGYIRKGEDGILNSAVDGPSLSTISTAYDYITVNTTFRVYKTTSGGIEFYAGAGPRLDFNINAKLKGDFLNESLDIEEANKVIIGLKTEAGINYHFGKMQVGLNFSYLPSFIKPIEDSILKDRTFTVGLVLGYALR